MGWDAAKDRRIQGPISLDSILNLSTPYRARSAARLGGWAAALLAITHALSGLRLYFEQRLVDTWLGLSPTQAALSCAILALAGLYLNRVILKRWPLWACITVLAWAVLESQRWITFHLYGHVAIRFLPYLALFYSVMGVRGALAVRRLAKQPEVFDPPAA